MNPEYIIATDFDRAWYNFEPTIPLEPLSNGSPNPFYVDRPNNPSAQLEDALNSPYYAPPKYFFSGHQGCGKSTELRRLAVNPKILNRYFPIHFSIRDEADITNLDFKDVLLAIGGRIYRAYKEAGGKLPAQLERELENWRGKVSEEIVRSDRLAGFDVEGGLDVFFTRAALRMKLEPATRHQLRQVIERDVSGLIEVINKISVAIETVEKRLPLVLIDDLDKPDPKTAKDIFYEHRETIQQPNCAIVYTVSSSIFYNPEYTGLAGRDFFLPSVTLHEPGETRKNRAGYATMRDLVHRRLDPALITAPALNEAVRVSGGVFREMTRVMRLSIQRARHSERIEIDHVRSAEAEIRGQFRRLLTPDQRKFLRQLHTFNRLDDPQMVAPLLQILAVIEYANGGQPWCDIHPALADLLAEEDEHAAQAQTQTQ